MIHGSLQSFLFEVDLVVNSPTHLSELGFKPPLSRSAPRKSLEASLHGLRDFLSTVPSFSLTSIDKCSAILLSCKSDARHYEIPKFDNDALALELVDNKLDQHSFFISNPTQDPCS